MLTEPFTVFYQSTVRGVAEAKAKDETPFIYVGHLHRIPSADFAKIKMLDHETNPGILFGDRIGNDGSQYEPAPGETIEGYEAWDIETGDVLVLWRVPYRLKASPEFN